MTNITEDGSTYVHEIIQGDSGPFLRVKLFNNGLEDPSRFDHIEFQLLDTDGDVVLTGKAEVDNYHEINKMKKTDVPLGTYYGRFVCRNRGEQVSFPSHMRDLIVLVN